MDKQTGVCRSKQLSNYTFLYPKKYWDFHTFNKLFQQDIELYTEEIILNIFFVLKSSVEAQAAIFETCHLRKGGR